MNEKIFFIVCILLFCFTSCRTSGGIYNHGRGTFEVRENIGKLGDAQTESAIANTELKSEIERSLDEVRLLELSIANGTGDIEELKAILRRIRERARYKNSEIRRTD